MTTLLNDKQWLHHAYLQAKPLLWHLDFSVFSFSVPIYNLSQKISLIWAVIAEWLFHEFYDIFAHTQLIHQHRFAANLKTCRTLVTEIGGFKVDLNYSQGSERERCAWRYNNNRNNFSGGSVTRYNAASLQLELSKKIGSSLNVFQ